MPEPVVINDHNWRQHLAPIIDGERKGRGYRGMWKPGFKAPREFKDLGVPLIPESEWADRIQSQEQSRSNLYHFAIDNDLPCLDQGGTNYCWINAPTYCCEVIRLQQSLEVVSYSPASAGARIKNFRNVGGWGSEGLEWMKANGVNLTEDWPDNALQKQYNTSENQQKAKLNRVVEYFVLRSWEEVVSCILATIPVAVGYNWWSHEVTGTHLRQDLALGIRNSWGMGWGDKGFGYLEGRKKLPDDAVAIVSMSPS